MQYHHVHGIMRRSASIRFRQLSAQQPWNGPVDRAFSQGDVLFVEIATARWEAAYCLLYMTQALPSICHIDLFLDNSYHSTKRFKSRELMVKMFLCRPKGRRARHNNLWHPCPKWQAERFFWHAAFHAVQTFLFLLPDQRLYTVKNMCIYAHISDCVEIVYELQLLQIILKLKHFYTNQEGCEVLTEYLSLGYRPGGDFANTWHWTKRFTIFFQTGSNSSPSYCHIFFFIAFLEQAFIWNIIITLCIIFTVIIIVCINKKGAIINNKYGRI